MGGPVFTPAAHDILLRAQVEDAMGGRIMMMSIIALTVLMTRLAPSANLKSSIGTFNKRVKKQGLPEQKTAAFATRLNARPRGMD